MPEAWQIVLVLTVTVSAHLLYDWYFIERHQSCPDKDPNHVHKT